METNAVCIGREKLEELENQISAYKEEVDLQRRSIQVLSERLAEAEQQLNEGSPLHDALEELEIHKKALGILARRHAVKTELSPHPSVAAKIKEWALKDARKGM